MLGERELTIVKDRPENQVIGSGNGQDRRPMERLIGEGIDKTSAVNYQKSCLDIIEADPRPTWQPRITGRCPNSATSSAASFASVRWRRATPVFSRSNTC